MLSSCEHPYKHFQTQLLNMTITRDIVDLEKTLLETMKVVNSNRFIYGSSHRINGI